MLIYIVIALLLILLSLFDIYTATDSKYSLIRNYSFFVISLFLFLVAGFRTCGFDYENYYGYFLELNSPYWFERGFAIGSEPGYSLINYVLGNYPAVIASVTLMIFLTQFSFFKRYSHLPFLCLLFYVGLFFYPSTMGQYRQALSIGIVLWAIVNRESRLKFFSLIALAMLFHFSAILGVLVLFIPKALKSAKFYIVIFVLALMCSMVANVLYVSFLDSLPTYVATKLKHYAATETTPFGLNTAVLLRTSVFFICFYFRRLFDEDTNYPYFMNVYFLSLIIYTALGFAPQVAGRGSIYFSIMEVILASNLIFALRKWKKSLFILLAFMLISLYRQFSFFNTWSDDYIPYTSILQSIF